MENQREFKKWLKENKVDYNDYVDFVERRSKINPNKYNCIEEYNKALRESYLKHRRK